MVECSLSLSQKHLSWLWSHEHKVVAAEGTSRMVLYDYAIGKKVPIPEALANAVHNLPPYHLD